MGSINESTSSQARATLAELCFNNALPAPVAEAVGVLDRIEKGAAAERREPGPENAAEFCSQSK